MFGIQNHTRPRRLWAAWLVGILAVFLSGCLSLETSSAPTATVPEPTASATIAFPTLSPTNTPTAPPSPTSTPDLLIGLGEVLYRDSFNENQGWSLGQKPGGGASLIEGRLAIAVRQPGAAIVLRSPAPASTNFFVEVSIRPELCRTDDEFGLVHRLNSSGEHYRFTITCDGGARVRRSLLNETRALVPFGRSPAVVPGPLAVNKLGVWGNGIDFRFYVNDVELFTIRDSALASGDIGLYVRSAKSGQTTVLFDNLVVRPLLPTPTPSQTPSPTDS